MMWWWGGEHLGAAGWIGLVFMIVFWVAFIVGIVFLIRYLAGRGFGEGAGTRPHATDLDRWRHNQTSQSGDALRILEERYARGEIEREEFLRRRDDLLGRP